MCGSVISRVTQPELNDPLDSERVDLGSVQDTQNAVWERYEVEIHGSFLH